MAFCLVPQIVRKGVKKMQERKNSEARIRANNKYNAKAYDRVNIAIPKGRKEVIQAHAAAQGKSVNGYVVEAIDEKLNRDDAQQIEEGGDDNNV